MTDVIITREMTWYSECQWSRKCSQGKHNHIVNRSITIHTVKFISAIWRTPQSIQSLVWLGVMYRWVRDFIDYVIKSQDYLCAKRATYVQTASANVSFTIFFHLWFIDKWKVVLRAGAAKGRQRLAGYWGHVCVGIENGTPSGYIVVYCPDSRLDRVTIAWSVFCRIFKLEVLQLTDTVHRTYLSRVVT